MKMARGALFDKRRGRRFPTFQANFFILAMLLPVLLLTGCPVPNGGEKSWIVMGTNASVKWNDNRDFPQYDAPDVVREVFARIEGLLNAHDPNSELSRLASLPDAEILLRCTPEVRSCYETAFRLRDQTGGAYDPRWKGKGTMDLGSIAKGFAVDVAIEGWVCCTVSSYWRILVDLGGNLKAAGTEGWRVGIKYGESFELTNGMACATSGEYFRGKHIYDGRTGTAVTNDLKSVTVIHPSSAMLADGLSTVMFILGRDKGEAFLKKHYPEAKAVWIRE